ncbi:hypothetical protein [Catenulispora pinisilvae]|uniref:hypothetical protein n=1 Tax=Catenulispora pinisilvae TaxID=2705253 RepID=UPI0018924713|nr:hypothetical protein [Catenulispora pinisilvae]
MKSLDQGELAALTAPLVALPAWGSELGSVGSMMTVEFGNRTVDGDGFVHGSWHLWIVMAAWRWETDDRVLAGSENDRAELKTALPALNGDTFQSVHVDAVSLEAVFEFTRSRLATLPIYSRNQTELSLESWMLWTPDGSVIVADPDQGIVLQEQAR